MNPSLLCSRMNTDATIICPLCNDEVNKLLYRYHLDGERLVIEKIKEQNPGWTEHDGICGRCVDYYQTEVIMQHKLLPEIGPYFPVKSVDDFIILPAALRLDANQSFTGKGITICFIDSGFYPHPDLNAHKNRIRKIVDIPNNRTLGPVSCYYEDQTKASSLWHGTMTSVVCAGNGFLSRRFV